MTKYWALIISFRPHVFSLGKHENFEEAEGMAQEFCDRKSKELKDNWEKAKQEHPDQDITEPFLYQLAYIMDENDLRALTGEVHRPFVIARARREVAVEAPERRGASTPHTCQDDGAPCGECRCEDNESAL